VTQGSVDEIRRAYDALDTFEADTLDKRKELRTAVAAALKDCDHTNPDGTSAVESGFIEDVCFICHRSMG